MADTKEKEKVKAPSKVLPCLTCKPHEFQDTRYGTGRRVHVWCRSGSASSRRPWDTTRRGKGYKCTVCGRTQPADD